MVNSIQFHMGSSSAMRNYAIQHSTLRKNMEKLSSGNRINRASDDAAGLAVSVMLSNQATGIGRAVTNARDGIGLVQTSDAALTEIGSVLNRMYDLSMQSANSIYGDEERAALQNEMDALSDEINRIAETSNFNGNFTLSGQDDGGVQLRLGEGLDSGLDVPGFDMRASALGVDGLRLDQPEAAADALGKIRDALDSVSSARGEYGAVQNRLNSTINVLSGNEENTLSALSLIRDTDIAEESMKLTQASILRQATQAMMAQANQTSYGVLRMIMG